MIESRQGEAEDASSCADLLVASVRDERRVAAQRLAAVARWANVHPPEAVFGATHARRYRAAVDEPTRAQVGGDGTPLVSPFAVAELWERFRHAEAWRVLPGVEATLDGLRRRALRLAVIANWDERLDDVLRSVGLRDRFDARWRRRINLASAAVLAGFALWQLAALGVSS